jgi:hypothetical protein
MPFNRGWDHATRAFLIDRDRTGPLPSPNTGTAQGEDGAIVSNVTNIDIPPATKVWVTIPGPREPVLNAKGEMSPRWWRFFEELYRRTGYLEDNINSVDTIIGQVLGGGSTAALVLAGIAPDPLVSHTQAPTTASLTTTGIAPSTNRLVTTSTGSLSLTGNEHTNWSKAPSVGSMSLAGSAPSILVITAPSAGSLALAGSTPGRTEF